MVLEQQSRPVVTVDQIRELFRRNRLVVTVAVEGDHREECTTTKKGNGAIIARGLGTHNLNHGKLTVVTNRDSTALKKRITSTNLSCSQKL
jgi:hypothetical protein